MLRITYLALFISYCFIILYPALSLGQDQSVRENQYEFGIIQSYDVFSEVYDPQSITSLHFGTDTAYGKYSLRSNIVNRFNETGYQFGFEAYPLLGNGKYAYLSYSYSNASIISKHRAGLELYLPFPEKSESSAGLRYLNFDSGSESWIATVSYNRYIGQYLVTLRPYFIFTDGGNGQTYFASVRRFLSDANDYIILRAAAGVATERNFFQLNENIIGEEILLLQSYQLGTELRKHLSSKFIGTASLDFFKQELRFDEGNFVDNWSFKAGIIYLF